MPDITMCISQTCPLRSSCYRSEASGTKPTPGWQTYSLWTPRVEGESVECEGYWKREYTARTSPPNTNQKD